MSTTATRIYQVLAEEIIRGIRPSGQKLEEQLLANEFSVSRTPVREALKNLAARGLVESQPRRGVVVAQLGLKEIEELLDAECELEAFCARLAALRMSAIEKSELEDIHGQIRAVVESGDASEYWRLNAMFHEAICNGVHNKTVRDVVSNLRERLGSFRRAQDDDDDRLKKAVAEHDAIVKAILAADATAAHEAMLQHNARLSGNVLRRMRKNSANGSG